MVFDNKNVFSRKCSSRNRTRAVAANRSFRSHQGSNPHRCHRTVRAHPLSYVTLVTQIVRTNWNQFVQAEGYFTKFSSLNTFSPGKRHISAPPEGRIGPNSRVGPPSDSSYQGGPHRNRRFSGTVFLRGCYTICKQLLLLLLSLIHI